VITIPRKSTINNAPIPAMKSSPGEYLFPCRPILWPGALPFLDVFLIGFCFATCRFYPNLWFQDPNIPDSQLEFTRRVPIRCQT